MFLSNKKVKFVECLIKFPLYTHALGWLLHKDAFVFILFKICKCFLLNKVPCQTYSLQKLESGEYSQTVETIQIISRSDVYLQSVFSNFKLYDPY